MGGTLIQQCRVCEERPEGCKALSVGRRVDRLKLIDWTLPTEEAPANSVPAAAVITEVRALIGITGRKGCVGWFDKLTVKFLAQPRMVS